MSMGMDLEVTLEFDNPDPSEPDSQAAIFKKILDIRNDFTDKYQKFITWAYPDKLRIDPSNKIKFNYKMKIGDSHSTNPTEMEQELQLFKAQMIRDYELQFNIKITKPI